MKRTRLRRTALALILTLTALPAFAGERPPHPTKTPSLLTWILQTLGRLVPALNEGRAGMDPNGNGPTTTPTSPSPDDDNDGRGTIDPDGGDSNG